MSVIKEQRTDRTHSDGDRSNRVENASTTSKNRALPPRTARHVAIALALLVILIIAVVATRKDDSLSSGKATIVSNARPLAVGTLVVGQVKPKTQTRSYSGTLVARFESQLSFERGGRVVIIGPHEGAFVEPGTVLAELAQDDLDATQHRIESELAAAQAVLAEFIAGPREQTIQAAAARVNELESRVLLAETNAKRQSKLAPQGATSQSQVDSASFGFEASRQSLVAAQALLQQLKEGTREEQIVAQRAKCDAIRGSLLEIEADRKDSRIVAPFAGAIQSRMIDPGFVVSPGSAVLHLVSHSLEAQISLPPAVAQSLPEGSAVALQFNGQSRTAWIDRVSPTIKQDTRTRDVFVRLVTSNADDQTSVFSKLSRQGWIAGEIVELILTVDDVSPQTGKHWLPISSLTRGARGLWTVLAVPGSASTATCERRSVELLKIDGTHALVQGMLQEGERVISGGLHRVTSGMVVQTVSGAHDRFDPSETNEDTGNESLARDIRGSIR